jgi:membrane protein DedA with SNARE-associated domain/rhodanese-related sulfurtransferase
MPFAQHLFLAHAYSVLFGWTLLEQLGLPLPSIPLLLMAGTLTATHKLRLLLVLGSVVSGSLVSDLGWFFLGKRYGGAVVRLLCRLTPERNTCVRRTEGYFGKHGAKALLFSKYIPGLNTMAGAIAGQTGMALRTFIVFDAAGALCWSVSYTVGGRFFGDFLKLHPGALAWFAHFAVGVFILLLAGFLVNRVLRRRRSLAEIRLARLSPEALRAMMDRGDDVYIVDLRHPLDYLPDPRTLPGAVQFTPDRLVESNHLIPRDRDVVLFCTCPNEETAVKMALTVRKLGVKRARPLLGGFDGWKKLGYPLVNIENTEVPLAPVEVA